MKLTHVGFRAHVIIAHRIVSCPPLSNRLSTRCEGRAVLWKNVPSPEFMTKFQTKVGRTLCSGAFEFSCNLECTVGRRGSQIHGRCKLKKKYVTLVAR